MSLCDWSRGLGMRLLCDVVMSSSVYLCYCCLLCGRCVFVFGFEVSFCDCVMEFQVSLCMVPQVLYHVV